MEALDIVIKTLETNDNPIRPLEIDDKAGLDRTEVDKAINQLKKEERMFSPKPCYYDLKK